MRADEGQTELNIKFQKRLNELANAINQVQKFETERNERNPPFGNYSGI